MPVLQARQFTPIQAPRGRAVHITSLTTPRRTACNKKCDGWKVTILRADCPACKLALVKKAVRR